MRRKTLPRRKPHQKFIDKVKPHPLEFSGYSFLCVISTKLGVSTKVQDYVGVVYDADIKDNRINADIKFIDLEEASQQMLDDIDKWDNSMPLNIYLGLKGYNLDRMIHQISSSTIRQVTGPIFSHPTKVKKIRKRKRIIPQ